MIETIKSLNWGKIKEDISEHGFAITGRFLNDAQCLNHINSFEDKDLYRSNVDMNRYNFGKGIYKYFAYPLPKDIQVLREGFYFEISDLAGKLCEKLKIETTFPAEFDGFKKILEENAQTRPTPLILKYGKGDYNCLHQDTGQDIAFPYQVVIGLSDPVADYSGGELILTQQRPRKQTVPFVMKIPKGAAVIFSSHFHPVLGKRGFYRTIFKHGVAKITNGNRYTIGIVFHDYKEKV